MKTHKSITVYMFASYLLLTGILLFIRQQFVFTWHHKYLDLLFPLTSYEAREWMWYQGFRGGLEVGGVIAIFLIVSAIATVMWIRNGLTRNSLTLYMFVVCLTETAFYAYRTTIYGVVDKSLVGFLLFAHLTIITFFVGRLYFRRTSPLV